MADMKLNRNQVRLSKSDNKLYGIFNDTNTQLNIPGTTLYIDPDVTSGAFKDGTSYFPFDTFSNAISSQSTTGNNFILMNRKTYPAVTLNDGNNFSITGNNAIISGFTYTNTAYSATFSNFTIAGNLETSNNFNASGRTIFENITVIGNAALKGAGSYTYRNVNFSNYDVIISPVNIASPESGTIIFENCNFHGNKLIINNPMCRVIIKDCEGLSIDARKARLITVDGSTKLTVTAGYGIIVEKDVEAINLINGICLDLNQELVPIQIKDDGGVPTVEYSLGTFKFDNENSDMNGIHVNTGIHTSQIRDDKVRDGYTTTGNSLEEHLDGISDALETAGTGTGGIEEAPDDGKIYGRQSEDWTEITAGGTWTYSNSNPVVATTLIAPTGQDLSGKTQDQILDLLFFPYQEPAFTTFSRSSHTATLEVGASTVANPTFTWVASNPGNVDTATLKIVNNSTSTTLASGFTTSPVTTTEAAITKTSASSNTWRLSGTNTQGNAIANRDITTSWQWRRWYGESDSDTLTETDIKALRQSGLSNSATGTFAFNGGGYKYLVIPTTMTAPTTFKDQATQLAVPMVAPVVVSITNSFGITQNYNVIRTLNKLGGAITIVVSA